MGISEEATIEQLIKIVEGIIAEERKSRQSLLLQTIKKVWKIYFGDPMEFYNMHDV